MSSLLLAMLLTFPFTHVWGGAPKCHTKDASLMYRCDGSKLYYRGSKEAYRDYAKTDFSVSVCRFRGQTVVEVFPFSLFTDHATDTDAKRVSVHHGLVEDFGFQAKNLFKTGTKLHSNSRTLFSVNFSKNHKPIFEARFFDGTEYDSFLQADVLCARY